MYNAHRRFFRLTEHFCIDNVRVIDGKYGNFKTQRNTQTYRRILLPFRRMQRAATVGDLLHWERVHSLTIASLTGNSCNLQPKRPQEWMWLFTHITSRNDKSGIWITALKQYNELVVEVQGTKLESTSDNIANSIERQKQICLEFSCNATIKSIIRVLNHTGRFLHVLVKHRIITFLHIV
jgi:hypothetical protein